LLLHPQEAEDTQTEITKSLLDDRLNHLGLQEFAQAEQR
jgi:hypothetical protein